MADESNLLDDIVEVERERDELKEVNSVLLAACEAADCSCTVAERDSGHKLGCWMPAMQDAIAKAKGL